MAGHHRYLTLCEIPFCDFGLLPSVCSFKSYFSSKNQYRSTISAPIFQTCIIFVNFVSSLRQSLLLHHRWHAPNHQMRCLPCSPMVAISKASQFCTPMVCHSACFFHGGTPLKIAIGLAYIGEQSSLNSSFQTPYREKTECCTLYRIENPNISLLSHFLLHHVRHEVQHHGIFKRDAEPATARSTTSWLDWTG